MSSIAFDTLLAAITTHPARRHTVFTTLAARKYSRPILARYLVNMARLCVELRKMGAMRAAFERWPYEGEEKEFRLRSAYQAVRYIDRREAKNEERFSAMARLLAPGYALDEHDLAQGTHEAIGALRWRTGHSADAMFRALGGLFASEITWYEQVTPGHVAAFVDGGFYGLSLDDVPYLKDLVSVTNRNQEAWMSWMVDKASLTEGEWRLMHEGAAEMLNAITIFYDDLAAILKDDDPA